MGLSKRVQNFICVTFAAFLLMHSVLLVEATTQSELQERINQNQNQLNQISGQMDALESQQEILDEQISDMNAELVNLYTSIDVLQDEITAKEQEIAEYITRGGRTLAYDGGAMWLQMGTPWAQRMSEPSDDMIRRIVLSVLVEFLD